MDRGARILLPGLANDTLGRRTVLPRVVIKLLPEYRHPVLPVVISTTVIFALIGPPFTRLALQRTSGA